MKQALKLDKVFRCELCPAVFLFELGRGRPRRDERPSENYRDKHLAFFARVICAYGHVVVCKDFVFVVVERVLVEQRFLEQAEGGDGLDAGALPPFFYHGTFVKMFIFEQKAGRVANVPDFHLFVAFKHCLQLLLDLFVRRQIASQCGDVKRGEIDY